jgi:hypothetical protein
MEPHKQFVTPSSIQLCIQRLSSGQAFSRVLSLRLHRRCEAESGCCEGSDYP